MDNIEKTYEKKLSEMTNEELRDETAKNISNHWFCATLESDNMCDICWKEWNSRGKTREYGIIHNKLYSERNSK